MNVLLFSLASIVLLLLVNLGSTSSKPVGSIMEKYGLLDDTCSTTCGINIDAVNDPEYNVRETIKNTLLLEDHLADKKKYCKMCIVKHFLLSQAYISEAIWMAGKDCCRYEGLEDSKEFFEKVFDEWYAGMDNEEVRLQTLSKLRGWRRKMIEIHYFGGASHSGNGENEH